jgi:cytochrome c oxidase subunit 2
MSVAMTAAAMVAGSVVARPSRTLGSGATPIPVVAKRFEYVPSEITVKRGEPVTLEITSVDRKHGFTIPALGVRADLKPGEKTTVRFTPAAAGRFDFHCDLFCGSGHEGMSGAIVVVE